MAIVPRPWDDTERGWPVAASKAEADPPPLPNLLPIHEQSREGSQEVALAQEGDVVTATRHLQELARQADTHDSASSDGLRSDQA
jgi:hypothetical protein